MFGDAYPVALAAALMGGGGVGLTGGYPPHTQADDGSLRFHIIQSGQRVTQVVYNGYAS